MKELAAEGAKVKLVQTSETLKHTRENYDKGEETFKMVVLTYCIA